jgi:hypothetical protein
VGDAGAGVGAGEVRGEGTGGLLRFKDEVNSAEEAEGGPGVVPRERSSHVEEGEGCEDGEGDDLLENFQLGEGEGAMADAVGGHLEEVLEESDAPADGDGEEKGLGFEVLEVGIPSEGHEEVGDEEEADGFGEGHGEVLGGRGITQTTTVCNRGCEAGVGVVSESMMRVQVQGYRISGWKAVLGGMLALVAGGVIAVLSVAALVVGLMVSVAAGLVFRARGMLGGERKRGVEVFEAAPARAEALEVREIQVDEVVVERERR